MKTVGILSRDKRLIRKLELLLDGEYEALALTDADTVGCDVMITDTDSFTSEHKRQVRLSRDPRKEDALTIPFIHSELIKAVRATDCAAESVLSLSETEYAAYLGARRIKLTEVEYKLLGALLSAEGFASRQALLEQVWGGERDAGIVNVYVHYLREKLECEGEKIILSSRREGYRIDKKYRRKTEC